MAGTEGKLQELDKVVKESKKKGLTMSISKRVSLRQELQIGDIKIKQVQKFNYQGSVITEDGKYDTEIEKCIGMAKNAFQKLNKMLSNRNFIRNSNNSTKLLCNINLPI